MATHGIRRIGFLLLGGPGETRASVDESLDFGEFLHLEMLNFTVGIRLYPPSSRLFSRNRPGRKPMRLDSAYQTQRECLLAGLSGSAYLKRWDGVGERCILWRFLTHSFRGQRRRLATIPPTPHESVA